MSRAVSIPQQAGTPQEHIAFPSSVACMIVVGLIVRLVVMWFWGLQWFDASHWRHYEMAVIGYSLYIGHGFSSPWGGNTGPTAWTAPLYPWLVSLVFRIFGPYSDRAAVALLTFNSVFSALTSWTIYRTAVRLFNPRVAFWSGWIWALFPCAIYWSVTWIWETTLSAFLLSLLFMLTVEMEGDSRLWPWFRYGLVWGVAALTNTSLVSWLPFAGCWLAYQLYRSGKSFLLPAAVGAVVFWVLITPWIVRDYVVFHKLILIRGDLGSELRTGNNSLAFGTWVPAYRAGNDPVLRAQYTRMGEAAFDAEQTRLTRIWIAENPRRFAALSCHKFYYFWMGVPHSEVWRIMPLLMFLMTPLSFLGLVLALWKRLRGVFLFVTLLMFYPLIYYITFTTDRYHHPIEPELVILATFCVVSAIQFVRSRRLRLATTQQI